MTSTYHYNKKKRGRRNNNALSRKQARAVKAIVEAELEDVTELKFNDRIYTLGLTVAPLIYDLTSTIVLGTNGYDRIGLDIELKSIWFKFQLGLADTFNYMRIIFFQWYDDVSAAFPAWDDIFQYPAAGNPVNVSDFMSPYGLNKGKDRSFKVLKNIELILDNDNPAQIITGYIDKGFRKSINFGTASTLGNNHIFMMVVSDSAAIPDPTLEGVTRLRFTDS